MRRDAQVPVDPLRKSFWIDTRRAELQIEARLVERPDALAGVDLGLDVDPILHSGHAYSSSTWRPGAQARTGSDGLDKL
jgi:hypothetical protein